MTRSIRQFFALLLCALFALQGCAPRQPFYLGGHDEMAHYIGVATDIEYPDACAESLPDAHFSGPPLSLARTEPDELWDMTLEQAIHIALHNSKVTKTFGGVRVLGGAAGVVLATPNSPTQLTQTASGSPDANSTVYDIALQETDPRQGFGGVEAALADFDAQLSASMFWERTERPQNIQFNPVLAAFQTPVLVQDIGTFNAELTKKTAAGTQVSLRNTTNYSWNNIPSRNVPSQYETLVEAEVVHPFLRGGGVDVNRAPIVLARIRTDVKLTGFERQVRDLVGEVEALYWECYFAWRNLEAAKTQRDSVFQLWKNAELGVRVGTKNRQEEARVRQTYFQTRAATELALDNLFAVESKLRYLLGLAASDGRLIRPIDDPLTAEVNFDWHGMLGEALFRNPSVRARRWQIKQREVEMITARNQLLPQLDGTALYRWYGAGDHLWGNDGLDPPFPVEGSHAVEELFQGTYQEWRLGLSLALPVGFRRELAGMRHAQLQLARAHALHEETELEVVHQLTDAKRQKDSAYQLAQTTHNQRVAADHEVEVLQKAYELGAGEGSIILDQLLDAIGRRASAQATYYRNVVNYNVAITQMHLVKGSLLELNNILLAEGPWPAKAYFDAEHQARRRAAGHYLDYGMTKPAEVSAGPVDQFPGIIAPHMHPQSEEPEPVEAPDAVEPLPQPEDEAAAVWLPAQPARFDSSGRRFGRIMMSDDSRVERAGGRSDGRELFRLPPTR